MTHWRLLLIVLLGTMLCIRAMEPMEPLEERADVASSTSTSTCEAENASSCEAETANDVPKVTKEDDMYEKLIEWIRSHKNGIVSEKLEIRRANPEDAASGYGLFTKEKVQEGELLYSIPWDLIITPENDDYKATSFSCGTTRTLIQEAKKGKESSFYPYLRLFEEWDRYKAPLIEDWTEHGKDLLETITGTRLPPQNWRDKGYWLQEWHNYCDGGSDELSEKAAMFVETRAEDALLVPLFDMSNHANGNPVNVVLEIGHLEYFDGLAHRDIEAGEQLNHSYNLCENCGSRITSGYGTPQLFRDYGFVEQYPQRWNFGEGVRVDIHKRPDKYFSIDWIDSLYPTRRGRLILEEEKDRLDFVVSRFLDRTRDLSLPAHEYETCKRYLQALYTAVHTICTALQMAHDEATLDKEPATNNSDTNDNNNSGDHLEDDDSEEDLEYEEDNDFYEEVEDDDADEEPEDDLDVAEKASKKNDTFIEEDSSNAPLNEEPAATNNSDSNNLADHLEDDHSEEELEDDDSGEELDDDYSSEEEDDEDQ